eukprot:14288946-Ditylum_brightwellii.AAC.1
MLGAVKCQSGAESMVVELREDIFKDEVDVCAWIESNLPDWYPFGMCVDIYVMLELILIRHTNIQASTMEYNMKLNLQADEALVLKTFENKLPTLFGQPASESMATRMGGFALFSKIKSALLSIRSENL